MKAQELLPPGPGLRADRVDMSGQACSVDAVGRFSAACPECGARSTSRHSRYRRKLQDLPVQGKAVTLHLQMGRWRCRNVGCPRKIFAERVPRVAVPWARRTNRLRDLVCMVGHGMGGRPGERLMHQLGMPVSDDTLLRSVKRVQYDLAPSSLRVVGVDDWAWKKGQTYGTILVDLERRAVVDLLAERSAASTAAWLAANPEVEFVSRDRHGLYADGVRRGAPQAQQIADRFHLVFNLGEAVELELARERSFLSIPRSPEIGPTSTKNTACRAPSRVVADRARILRERHETKQRLFEDVHRLHACGESVSSIVRQTGLGRKRVTKWITLPELPMRNTMEPTSHTPDSYHDYLAKRWGEGCRHGRSLLKEIQELGYTGCFSYLARFLASWRRTDKPLRARTKIVSTEANLTSMPLQSCSRRQISPQVASALLGKLRTQMTETQRQTVDTLKSNCPGFTTMRSLVMGFRTILRAGTIKSLHIWMKRAQSSGIYGMQRFVHRLRQDLSAVEAAVTETWSNGPVEGHVARLKTIKRQMYGRAGFELLRARVLPLTTLTRLHQE
jgi:transposase